MKARIDRTSILNKEGNRFYSVLASRTIGVFCLYFKCLKAYY